MPRTTLGAHLFLGLTFAVGYLQSKVVSTVPPSPPGHAEQRAADAQTPPVAVGSLVGRVTAGDTGRPLRRARVRLTGSDYKDLATSTDETGRYEFTGLQGGTYTVTASRSGYLTLKYGQRRPLEPAKPLTLAARQSLEKIDFVLPRMSIVSGRITDEIGDPVSNVAVSALRAAYFEGARRLVPANTGIVRTDDDGQYRLLGLMPGQYFVMATVRETWTSHHDGVTEVMGYAPTYAPGSARLADARPIVVGAGRESAANDFSLVPGRTATVTGFAMDSRGRPLSGQSIDLAVEFRGPNSSSMQSFSSAVVHTDGSFSITHVAPGSYTLMIDAAVGSGSEAAVVPVEVDGTDIDGISVITSLGWGLTGMVTADAARRLPYTSRQPPYVVARPLRPAQHPRVRSRGNDGRVNADGTFEITGLFGPMTLRLDQADDVTVVGIFRGGRDVTDAPLEVNSGETLSDIEVVVSTRMCELTGKVLDSRGSTVTDGTVIVFSQQRDKWTDGSRYTRIARPDQYGQYRIIGLPPGTYHAVALDNVEDGAWDDPSFLEGIKRFAIEVALDAATSKELPLKLSDTEAL